MIDEPLPGFRSWDKEAAEQPATPIADEVAGYDMLYSSGTTGRPKGIKRNSKTTRSIVPNPFLKILCADMCGMIVRQHLPVAGAALSRRSACAST